jgi:hypothetical protein
MTIVDSVLKVILDNSKINWGYIQDYSKTKDLYDYCVKNIGLDYNNLYEFLEGYTFLTSETITSMNTVSKHFCTLNQ